MSIRLIESLGATEPLAEVFSDLSVLQAMLDFEVALARAEAQLRIIPQSAARAIARAARAEGYDGAALARGTLRAGTPGIPLVNALRKKVQQEDAFAADYVHWGATSQDVADTALVLLLRKSAAIFNAELARMEKALRVLSAKHKNTVMLGRTLLQPAPPVTLGLKTAGWLASVRRGRARLNRAISEAQVLQFGGASGTLSALEGRGIQLSELIARQLGLRVPDAPWHAHRDRLAEVVCACAILTGSLGKMARDISLLMQHEVGEVAEPGLGGRGGSSTMPHKRNPIASALTLAAANRVPGLAAAFLSQMVQEHERAAGGWQAEWPTVASVIQSTGVALASMAEVAEGLSVDPRRMRQNIQSTHGAPFSEKVALRLTAHMGREKAHEMLRSWSDPTRRNKRTLSEALAEVPEARRYLGRKYDQPDEYLGSAQDFIRRLSRNSRPRRRK
ncbi:MAG TPA: 3-carboxy-cis,cis-muconate cycloisomerase [Terriglobales bacterium]|nr:3-carboxy-cis,cis-muconate cycloisomerase [Terriglobales bacterium]